ncbi:MAG: hypothetical protein IKD44_02180 [Lentisphaeria bacterium]|nr:hypothetical protein [Lentisphaeria bacterium]
MEFKRVILFSGYTAFNGILPPEEFKKFAAVAAETGFTHVDLGCSMLERSRHQLPNNGVWCKDYDFYPEYTAAFPGFFKFYVPGALKAYLPEETAKRNLESMHVRAEILQSLGLKGSFLGGEPQFLPEKAFQDHPEWRGARCDFAGRSQVAYWSPCIDQPEILSLYSEAANALCDAAPCIEYVHMLTGDSGNGICWGELYTGTNGPEFCRNISTEQRVSTYCGVLTDAMKKHGHEEPMAVLHRSPPWGRSVPVRKVPGSPGGTIYSARGYQDKPVCHEDPVSILEEIAKADGFENLIVNIEAPELQMRRGGIYPEVIKSALGSKPRGTTDIACRIKSALGKSMPEADAEKMTDGFFLVSQALKDYQTTLSCNFFYGNMSERWLTRPLLVCIPPMDSEETAFYRNHIFSVNGESAFRDYLDFHGGRWVRFGKTREEAFYSAFICANIIGKLDKAIELFGPESDAGWRTRALRVLVKNIRHLLLFTYYHDQLRATGETPRPAVQQIMRAEVDNCSEMITILEKGPANVIHLAETKEMEHTFRFGPDLADQLRLKQKLMFDHWHDLDDVLTGKKPPVE